MKPKKQTPDLVIVTAIILLLSIGVLMVYSASAAFAYHKYDDAFFFAKRQVLFASLGVFLMFLIAKIDPSKFREWAKPSIVICFILLLTVLIPGVGILRNGARSWLGIGAFSIQPSEFMKLAMILFLARMFSNPDYDIKHFTRLETGMTPDPDCLKDYPNWVSVEGIVDAIEARGELPRSRHALHTRIGHYLRPFVQVDTRGQPDTSRPRRLCVMVDGQPVSDDIRDPETGAIRQGIRVAAVRRKMYKLKPLGELRDLHRHLVDAWPEDPVTWISDAGASQTDWIQELFDYFKNPELAREYERACGIEPKD